MTLKEFARCCLTELTITIIELKDYVLIESQTYKGVEAFFTASLNAENKKLFDRKVKWFAEDLDRDTMKVRII